MANKLLEKGDKVKCVGLTIAENVRFIRIGDTGTIVTVDEDCYLVKWDNPNEASSDHCWWCDLPDVELVA